MRSRTRAAALLGAVALSSSPSAALGAPGPLDVDPVRDGAILAAGLGVAAALAAPGLAPKTCHFCTPNALDAAVTRELVWTDPARARVASDVLANAIVPAGAAGALLASAWTEGDARLAAADLLAVAEAAAIALDLNQLAKDGVARLRPAPYQAGVRAGGDASRSFYSGHTSFAFSVATAAGTVSSIRGYRAAPWIWGVGLALAGGVGSLRVAGDAHWLTDVLAGAAIGGGVGFASPWLLNRPRPGRRRVALAPAPGGIALVF